MKTLHLFALLILSPCAGLDPAALESQNQTIEPESVIIVYKERYWSIDELNKLALDHLRSVGSMPKEAKPNTVVHVHVEKQKSMCEFLYLQGFGLPCWHVEIGFDGKVRSFRKEIKTEGRR